MRARRESAVVNTAALVRRAAAVGLACVAVLAAAQQTDAIQAGDVVFVDVYRRPELSSTVQVGPNGNIDVPYVGNVNIAGLSDSEAAARVSAALKAILKNPRVSISRTSARMPSGPRTAEMQTQVIAVKNSSAEVLSEALQGMSSSGGSISCDRFSNAMIITDTPATVQNIMTAISQIDQMRTQVTQVHIETKVVEVKQGAMKELGVRWFYKGDETTAGYYPRTSTNALLSSSGGQSDPMANERLGGQGAAGGTTSLSRRFVDEPLFDRRLNVPVQVPVVGQLFLGVMNGDFDIGTLLDALVKDNKAELLATPSILAVNHTPAEIKMLDEFPYTESSQYFGGQSFSVKFMDLGIKLLVTPHVYQDTGGPYVKLDLKPEVSFASGMANGIPIRSVRSSESMAIVRDGQTLVIGGILLSDERSGKQEVPGLGKIPVLGSLFKRKERTQSRSELMVFVTPKIHETPESVTWDRTINLTGAAKDEVPRIPTNEVLGETRKE